MNAQQTLAMQTQLAVIQSDHTCVHVILAIQVMASTAQVWMVNLFYIDHLKL